MKISVLIILCSHEMNPRYFENIKILNHWFTQMSDISLNYCGISNTDDFHHYENIISFTYKKINPKFQFSKICDFISEMRSELNYDWYIKIRPDMKLLEPIPFDILSDTAINARSRNYIGPKKIKYGSSVNGEGCWKHIIGYKYNINETEIIMDDMLFIFHQNVIKKGAFDPIIYKNTVEHEWVQTSIWKKRNIPFNIIGINMQNTKYNAFSGHINM